jgi:hypothetical protein
LLIEQRKLIQSAGWPLAFLLLGSLVALCILYCQSLVRCCRRCLACPNTNPDSVDPEAQAFCLPFSRRWYGPPGPPPDHPHAAIDLKQFNTKPGIPSPPPAYSVRQICTRTVMLHIHTHPSTGSLQSRHRLHTQLINDATHSSTVINMKQRSVSHISLTS